LTTRGGLTEYAGGCRKELPPAFQRVVEGTMLAGREDLGPPEDPAAVLGGRCSMPFECEWRERRREARKAPIVARAQQACVWEVTSTSARSLATSTMRALMR
jgi:hypothetical protein